MQIIARLWRTIETVNNKPNSEPVFPTPDQVPSHRPSTPLPPSPTHPPSLYPHSR